MLYEAILGVDTLRITISQAGLDPKSPNYDPNYLSEIQKGVRLGQAYDFVVILDMNAQQDETQELACMPSESTIRAWKTIAPSFIHDRVVLELFNEPCKSWNEQNKALWAQSMQALVNSVRGLGSTNILLLDGLWYARSTNGLLPLVHDTIPNHFALAAHPYFVKDVFVTEKQWHDQFGASAAQYPLIITEWNATSTNGCVDSTTPEIALSLMRYLESLHVGLIGWGLDSNYGKLVKDHTKYEPTDYSTFIDCSKTPGIAGGGKLLANFPKD
jgi:endoglucanase